MKKKVYIIGGGPAGLSAANELLMGGDAEVIVLEKAPMVGGISRTESYKGYHFDIGGHRFFTKNPSVQALWDDILKDDFIKVPRLSRIFYKDKYYQYPIKLFNTFFNLGPVESFFILISFFKIKIFPLPKENTFEEWVTNRFGERLYRTFFKTYTEKVWGIPCTSIQSDWAAQRIQGLSLTSAVANALFGSQKAKTLIDEFDYPKMGPGMMWEGFQKRISENGGTVLLNTEAVAIRHEQGRVYEIDYLDGDQIERASVDALITSTPINLLVQLMDPPPPETVSEAASGLSYRAFLIVVLIVKQPDLFPDQWIYIHSPDVKVGRIQNFRNWSPAMVPDKENSSIGLEYFCDEGDEIWAMADHRLAELAGHELEALGLAKATDVVDHYVVRQSAAYPVYDEAYSSSLETVKSYLDGFENMQTVGRSGMHRYNNMDHSMVTGIMAAQNLQGAEHHIWDVNDDDDYLEEGTRELVEAYMQNSFARMGKFAFGISIGMVSGFFLFIATLFLVLKGGAVVGPNLALLGQFLPGYQVSYPGAFIGMINMMAVGFVIGWIFAFFRNLSLAWYIYSVRKKAERGRLRDFIDYI